MSKMKFHCQLLVETEKGTVMFEGVGATEASAEKKAKEVMKKHLGKEPKNVVKKAYKRGRQEAKK